MVIQHKSMVNKQILLVFLLAFAFILPLINAEVNEYAPVKQNDCIEIKQVCASCSYVNITVSYPNSTRAVTNIAMTSVGSGNWIYNFCDTSLLGRYDVTGEGDISGTPTGFDVLYFEVTQTGRQLNQSKSILYVLVWIICFLIMIGLIYLGINIPYSNKRDEMSGYILAVNNIKYLKMLFLALAYVVAVFISYLNWMISYSYLDMEFLSNILRFVFTFMAVLTLPLFILYTYLNIANLIRDSQIGDALLRGLRIK
jgi:hypothetical protein